LLVFDGDCHFCRRWVERFRRITGDATDYLAYQDPSIAAKYPEISEEEFSTAVHLILPDGTYCSGAEAAFRALSEAGKEKWLYSLYRSYDFVENISETIYEEVALHRSFFSSIDRVYSGPGVEPLNYIRVRFLFLRGLALIYLVAFMSLAGQIQGLSGSHGIVPAQPIIDSLKVQFSASHVGLERFHLVPTLCWFSASDQSLNWQCWGGVALSVLLLFGIAPAPVLFLLWILYLSLSSVCSPFLNFQWDLLLLETGFLAIFFAPLQLFERPSRQSPPSAMVLWLLRWLMFRLMLESGCVKLLSGDVSWTHFTALRMHYETQPLPTWIGWYAHQLPAGFQTFSVIVMFFIELVVPVFIIAGRRARIAAAIIFAAFQILILLTGNYTFFNYLTILLCVPLLDDESLPWPRKSAAPDGVVKCPRWRRAILLPISAAVVVCTFMLLLATLWVPQKWPSPIVALFGWVEPLRSFNHYGLFSVMTQTRPEIIIEGSNDGARWEAYQFKYKPGDLKERPKFVAPYQPRLDWQMWFAALGGPQSNPWIINFEARLLQNAPEVTNLLAKNPFANTPPKYIRAELYEYHFTDMATRRATGEWWKREYKGPFLPPISLNGQTQPP
jgi:predicted DCC family thiol-disulfide oxidoreductase YuxK/uncharacterized membrane protein YphA (DoxX/SURF4 family)